MTEGLLDGVRRVCAAVAARARAVHLHNERIAAYAAALPLEVMEHPAIDPRYHVLAGDADTVAYFITLDTVNFGSGYFPHLAKREGLSGYFTIVASLKERWERGGPFSAEELCRLTPVDCARIFAQEPAAGPRGELMALFATALQQLGDYLLRRFDGDCTRLVAAAENSAERLATLLLEMPFYRDVERYDELEVPFYKRAQLAAADLALAFDGRDDGRFEDLDRLTMFADNLVPHVLRMDGIVEYEEALLARIEGGELIASGSREEIEIRATAVQAVELLVQQLRECGTPVTARELDYFLWTRGQQPHYKARPRHRTRTVFY